MTCNQGDRGAWWHSGPSGQSIEPELAERPGLAGSRSAGGLGGPPRAPQVELSPDLELDAAVAGRCRGGVAGTEPRRGNAFLLGERAAYGLEALRRELTDRLDRRRLPVAEARQLL